MFLNDFTLPFPPYLYDETYKDFFVMACGVNPI